MKLTLTILGLHIFTIDATTDPPHTNSEDEDRDTCDTYDCTTNVVGFTHSHGDQRWQEHTTPEYE